MTKTVKKAAAAETETPAVEGIAPVYALNKVTYGKGKEAPARSLFQPTSAVEREEIIETLQAGREPTEAELAIWAQTGGAVRTPEEAATTGTETGGAETTSGTTEPAPEGEPGADNNPLG